MRKEKEKCIAGDWHIRKLFNQIQFNHTRKTSKKEDILTANSGK